MMDLSYGDYIAGNLVLRHKVFYFVKEVGDKMPIKPKPNESQDDFMARCIPIELDANKPQDQAVAICLTAFREQKGGESLEKLTQELLDTLEKKEFEIEIKSVNEKGQFKGMASPFNNVDNGNDRVLPSISKRNVGKIVPMLLQHEMATEQGEMKLYATKDGIAVEGQLYLDILENGNPVFPEAYKSYHIGKRGKMKLSIGYRTFKFSYDSKGVRNLEDIEIMEVSRVTIPMNSKAVVTDVKSAIKEQGVNDIEDVKDVEVKAATFAEILASRENRRKMYDVQDAFHSSMRSLMNDAESTKEAKILMLDKNLADFSTAYKEVMTNIINSGAKSEELELETKAGASISKANKGKLQSLMKQIQELLGVEEESKKENDNKLETKEEQSLAFEFKSTFTKEG